MQNSNTSFYQDTVRDTKQTAFFASVDFDIIPKVLHRDGGHAAFPLRQHVGRQRPCKFRLLRGRTPPGGCHNPAFSYNLNAANLSDTESGNKARGNLTWHITPDIMAYYTFSQGFRPGGFNQNGGSLHAYGTDGVLQYAVQSSY